MYLVQWKPTGLFGPQGKTSLWHKGCEKVSSICKIDWSPWITCRSHDQMHIVHWKPIGLSGSPHNQNKVTTRRLQKMLFVYLKRLVSGSHAGHMTKHTSLRATQSKQAYAVIVAKMHPGNKIDQSFRSHASHMTNCTLCSEELTYFSHKLL